MVRPCAGRTLYFRSSPGVMQAEDTMMFEMDGEDERVVREDVGLGLLGPGVVWSLVSGRSGGQHGLVEEQEEGGWCAPAADAQERATALHAELMAGGPAPRVVEVAVPHVPRMVVHGFHVQGDAVSMPADQLAGDEHGLHLEEREAGLDAGDGAGMRAGAEDAAEHVADSWDVHGFWGEELEVLSAYVDDIVQDGQDASGPVVDAREAAHDEQEADRGSASAQQPPVQHAWDSLGWVSDSEAEELPGDGSCEDSGQQEAMEEADDADLPQVGVRPGALQSGSDGEWESVIQLWEDGWSGAPADGRGLGVRLADAAAAFRRWALW